jgi:nucleotide-binding universal stress UspA family protein
MHASCPVVVVREETSAVHGEIAVGIRDPHDTVTELSFAFEEALLRGAALVAVHAWYWFPSVFGEPWTREIPARLTDPAKISAHASEHLTEMLSRWQEKYPTVPVRHDVVHGHPGRILASYTARADLVVIGRHDGHHTGPAVGAVQHSVLSHAHGPVAVVPVRS